MGLKRMNDNIIHKLIIEGRVEDMKAKYVDNQELPPIKRLRKDRFEKLVKGDPSGNQKYLEWMINQVIRGDIIGVTTGYILRLVTEFHEKQQRLPKKDLYQYSGYHELEKALKDLPPSKAEMKRIQKEGSVKLYEDERHLVVVPKTTEGSCYYGQGTRWCTAAKKNNQFENYSEDGVLFYIIDKTNPGRDENGHDFSKLALYVPNHIIDDYAGGIRYLDHYDIELYDATDDLLEDALWSDYVMSDDSNKLQMQDAMVKYFIQHATSDKAKGVKTDEKLLKGIEENWDSSVGSGNITYKFGNRWFSDDKMGLDLIDREEKYFITISVRTNNYDTVYLDASIYDYDNPGDALDSAKIEKRVPIEVYVSEFDFDPRLITWTSMIIKSLSTSLIKRYENKKRQDERQD
jgi:hypothetical protein